MHRQTDRWPLDPINRQSEVMFGLLLPLTFTGTMSLALGAGATVREILLAARGCNIAGGLVDAAVSLLTSATEHGRGRAQAAAIRAASDPGAKAQLRALMPGRAGKARGDAQVGAMAMAILLRGMDSAETVALTRAMTHSGEVLSWAGAGGCPARGRAATSSRRAKGPGGPLTRETGRSGNLSRRPVPKDHSA
jgi:hypothetical protein